MAQPYVAEIKMFGGNFAPRGYALCNGQIVAISQNTALFSLLGTTYGGNGTSTFALPNMQGRAPVHQGNGAGIDPVSLGEMAGETSVTLNTSNLPQHTHPISGAVIASSNPGETPASNTLFTNSAPNQLYATSLGTGALNLASQSITMAGGSQPHNNAQPYLAVTFIIAMEGIFPARN
ncbi:MAG TPA: tail fiber protein [Sphingomonas sp.]